MQYFDLHCDTLYKALTESKGLNEPLPFHISADRAKPFDEYIQCAAIWIPDGTADEVALQMLESARVLLQREAERLGFSVVNTSGDLKNSYPKKLIFTVENGLLLSNKLERIARLSELGVKMLTLTWNGENPIGSGILSEKSGGLTPFGRQAVTELEKNGITVDLSHASEALFYDALSVMKRPFAVSHSNCKKICSNPRNLTDGQILCVKKFGGIIGINLYKSFLNNDGESAKISDVIAHMEHILSLGCEDNLAFGSDFDGADVPEEIGDITGIFKIYNELVRLNYKKSLLDKIFYKNACDFFIKALTN